MRVMECLTYVARSFHDRDSRLAHEPINSHSVENSRHAIGVRAHTDGVGVKRLKRLTNACAMLGPLKRIGQFAFCEGEVYDPIPCHRLD